MPTIYPAGMGPALEKLGYGIPDASAVSGVGMTRIREAIHKEDLKARRNGAKIIILREDLIDWLRRLPSTNETNSRKLTAGGGQ